MQKYFNIYPFRRLIVYNSVQEVTYITWELHPTFQDPYPYYFQLQFAHTPNPEDTEWTNVGDPVENVTDLLLPWNWNSLSPYMQNNANVLKDVYYLVTAGQETNSYYIDKYFRIILTTPRGSYVSAAEGCFGQLRPREWKIAKEIIRKEKLRFGYTAIPCVLLKRRQYGPICPYCNAGSLAMGSTNARCEYCYGTGRLGGYYTPIRFQMADISPSRLKEMRIVDDTRLWGYTEGRYQGRCLGIPEIIGGDVIVDLSTAQRFEVEASPVIAQMHRVPLVRELDLNLAPSTDVIYDIPTGEELESPVDGNPDEPVIRDNDYNNLNKEAALGCGVFLLNQDFHGNDNLSYTDDQDNPIVGGTITIYKKVDEDYEFYITTKTVAYGRWENGVLVDPGTYKLVYEKQPDYGETEVEIEVTDADLSEEEKTEITEEEAKTKVNYINQFK